MSERDYILRAQAALGVDDDLRQLGTLRFAPVGSTSRTQTATTEPTEVPGNTERN